MTRNRRRHRHLIRCLACDRPASTRPLVSRTAALAQAEGKGWRWWAGSWYCPNHQDHIPPGDT